MKISIFGDMSFIFFFFVSFSHPILGGFNGQSFFLCEEHQTKHTRYFRF